VTDIFGHPPSLLLGQAPSFPENDYAIQVEKNFAYCEKKIPVLLGKTARIALASHLVRCQAIFDI